MNILYLAPLVPYPLNRGTHQRVYHLLTHLARRHDVTFFALDPDGQAAGHEAAFACCRRMIRLPVALQPWRGLSRRLLSPRPETMHHWHLPEVSAALRKLLQTQNFDLFFCEDICMAQYLSELLPELGIDQPVITDRNRVDLEFMYESRPYVQGLKARSAFEENLFKLAHFERRLLAHFPAQVVCSPEDASFLQARFGVAAKVIGNGIDADYFQPQPWLRPDGPPVLCFTGAMDYAPNADGIAWFIEQVYPLLRERIGPFRLRIVGLHPPAEIQAYAALDGVEVTGGVPDIRPAYAACDVYIAPIRIGGGTRLKILEALAMEKAVVATPTGAQGLGLISGEHALLAESPAGFVEAIVRLLDAPDRRQAMAAAGRAHVLTHFTWERLGAALSEHVETVYAAHAAQTPVSPCAQAR